MNDTSTRTIDDLLAEMLEARKVMATRAEQAALASAALTTARECEKAASKAYFAASDALRKPKRQRKPAATTGATP